MPALAAVYGLNWDDHLLHMPIAERDEYIEQLPRWQQLRAGMG